MVSACDGSGCAEYSGGGDAGKMSINMDLEISFLLKEIAFLCILNTN